MAQNLFLQWNSLGILGCNLGFLQSWKSPQGPQTVPGEHSGNIYANSYQKYNF